MTKNQLKQFSPSFYLLIWFYNAILPGPIVAKISKDSGLKHSILFSSVPGFIKPIYFGGGKVRRMFFCGSGPGNLATSITMVTCLKRTLLNITSDKSQIQDINSFAMILNEKLISLGLMYDPRDEGID